ncbi:Aliphatic sulfonates import ATP-binding protein SsuB [compost metagenome]
MTEPLLSLDKVSLSYGDIDVLHDISLDVMPGEFVSILGPSGAGKSTIFKLLTGAANAGSGEIRFAGKPLLATDRPFAFMPQRDALMPWRRIIDNTTLGLEVQGMPRKEARKRVAPLFGEFGLGGFEQHYPQALSGGMRQRAALLRTVVQERPVLLLDEPFGALDALTRNQMQIWLEAMWLRHRWTIILITHDVREAVMLSDRIHLLSPRPARVEQTIAVALPRARFSHPTARSKAATIETSILDFLLSPQINDQEGLLP